MKTTHKQILRRINQTNNGYIFLDRYAENMQERIFDMAVLGLVVIYNNKVFLPHAFKCYAQEFIQRKY